MTWSMQPVPVAPAQAPEGTASILSIHGPQQQPRQITAKTDASGTFAVRDLPPGSYSLNVSHSKYSQVRGPASKTVELKAGESAHVSFELTPGATITGRVVDEDGDPLPGCMPQVLPARPLDPVVIGGSDASDANGVYTLWGVNAGKFRILMRCQNAVLEPFPLQPTNQPRPAPTLAYAPTFYPGVRELQQAQIIEISPGTVKPGIDFQLKPARVFAVNGSIGPAGVELPRVQLILQPRNPAERELLGDN